LNPTVLFLLNQRGWKLKDGEWTGADVPERAREVAAYREAVRLATTRYDAGLSDYLEVLQAQQQLFPAENQLTQTRFNRLATLVELYRALGGGWKLRDEEWTRHP